MIFSIVEAALKAFWAAIILSSQAALLPLQIPTSMGNSRVFPLTSSRLKSKQRTNYGRGGGVGYGLGAGVVLIGVGVGVGVGLPQLVGM